MDQFSPTSRYRFLESLFPFYVTEGLGFWMEERRVPEFVKEVDLGVNDVQQVVLRPETPVYIDNSEPRKVVSWVIGSKGGRECFRCP